MILESKVGRYVVCFCLAVLIGVAMLCIYFSPPVEKTSEEEALRIADGSISYIWNQINSENENRRREGYEESRGTLLDLCSDQIRFSSNAGLKLDFIIIPEAAGLMTLSKLSTIEGNIEVIFTHGERKLLSLKLSERD